MPYGKPETMDEFVYEMKKVKVDYFAGSGFESDLEFCELMAEKTGVAAVPGSSFFCEKVNHLIRFHFANKNRLWTRRFPGS